MRRLTEAVTSRGPFSASANRQPMQRGFLGRLAPDSLTQGCVNARGTRIVLPWALLAPPASGLIAGDKFVQALHQVHGTQSSPNTSAFWQCATELRAM